MKFPKFLRIASLIKHKLNTANETMSLGLRPIDIINNKLIDLLSNKLGFSYKLVFPSDDEFGRLLPDGNWTGMVGMVHRGDADIIIDDLSVTEPRSKVIDFSQSYFIDRYTFATKFMKKSHNETAFLRPFTFEVWLTLIICFSITWLISNINKINIRGSDSKKSVRLHNTCSKSSKSCNKTSGMYFLMSSRLIAEAFLRLFYTSILLSFLVMPSTSDIRTIPDLAKAVKEDNYRCASFNNMYLPDVMANSQDPNFKVLGPCIKHSKGLSTIDVLNHKNYNKNLAYISTESHLKLFRKKYFVSADGILPDVISIGIKKGFCCKKQLDSTINNILASGILNKFIEFDYFHNIITSIHNTDSQKTCKQLSLKHFEGIFVLLFIGHSLSFIALVLEILICKFHKNRI